MAFLAPLRQVLSCVTDAQSTSARRGYRYRLDGGNGRELVSWHWHLSARSREQRPHLHIADGPLTGHHLPHRPGQRRGRRAAAVG